MEDRERLMNDSPTYQKLQREEATKMRRPKTVAEMPFITKGILEGPERFVFPSSIISYNFRRKKWVGLLPLMKLPILTSGLVDIRVDGIQDICWNKKAFENLVVDEETKELIQAD